MDEDFHAVDQAADTPVGTAKNYFPTRDALLRSAAEHYARCYSRISRSTPLGRAALEDWLRDLLSEAVSANRDHLVAYLELRLEAVRKPWLATILDETTSEDVRTLGIARHASGIRAMPQSTGILTLTLTGALIQLASAREETLGMLYLDDLDEFVEPLVDTILGRSPHPVDAPSVGAPGGGPPGDGHVGSIGNGAY